MKQTVSQSDFVRAFDDCNRSENFSIAGRDALFEYLEDLEQQTGEELELDPIGICCDFTEYDSAWECIEDCGYGFEAPEADEDEGDDDYTERRESEALEYLRDHTTVIEFDGGVIIQQF